MKRLVSLEKFASMNTNLIKKILKKGAKKSVARKFADFAHDTAEKNKANSSNFCATNFF